MNAGYSVTRRLAPMKPAAIYGSNDMNAGYSVISKQPAFTPNNFSNKVCTPDIRVVSVGFIAIYTLVSLRCIRWFHCDIHVGITAMCMLKQQLTNNVRKAYHQLLTCPPPIIIRETLVSVPLSSTVVTLPVSVIVQISSSSQ